MKESNFELELNQQNMEIIIKIEGHSIYSVDLEQLNDSACVLDTLAQVSMKGWASETLVGTLFQKMDSFLRFQGNYCAVGTDMGYKAPERIRNIVNHHLPSL